MSYLRQAFTQAIENRNKVGKFYVILWEEQSFYGGPEEGGWWGRDHIPLEYSIFSTEEEALEAKAKVDALAQKLSKEANTSFGEQCLKEMDFCDSRNLDYSTLPEPDGPEEYYVTVSDEPPTPSYGGREYC